MKVKSVVFAGSAAGARQFPKDGKPEIAFIGRSNVGKSSLINCLVNRQNLARVSKTPGKTQLVNFFLINEKFYFTDLPGFGYAKVPLSVRKTWQGMIEAYFAHQPAGVCWLFDIRREPVELDWQTHAWLTAANLPFRLVFTKADKLSFSQAKTKSLKLAETLNVADYQIFSVFDATGKAALWHWIKNIVG